MIIPNKFYNDIEEIIVHWKTYNPIRCHNLGIHDYDGLLPDYSQEAIVDRIREIKEDIVHLIALKRDYPETYTMFEFNLVKITLEKELYELAENKEYANNPVFYIRPLYLLDQSFTIRSFAPLDERIKIITTFLNNLPAFMEYPIQNLDQSLPDIKIHFSIQSLNGFITFLKNDLPKIFTQTQNKDIISSRDDRQGQ